jgi:hypothetical protein
MSSNPSLLISPDQIDAISSFKLRNINYHEPAPQTDKPKPSCGLSPLIIYPSTLLKFANATATVRKCEPKITYAVPVLLTPLFGAPIITSAKVSLFTSPEKCRYIQYKFNRQKHKD